MEHPLAGEQPVEADADEERGLARAGARHDEPHLPRTGARMAVVFQKQTRRAAQLEHQLRHHSSSAAAAAAPLYSVSSFSETSRGTGV